MLLGTVVLNSTSRSQGPGGGRPERNGPPPPPRGLGRGGRRNRLTKRRATNHKTIYT